MTKFKLEIKLDDAAFLHFEIELARILHKIAYQVANGCEEDGIYATDGDRVGEFKILRE